MAILKSENEVMLQGTFLKYGQRLYKKGKTPIYTQGQVGEGIFYLQKGLVKIVTVSSKGNERILDLSKPGQFFGEQVMDQQYYFSSAHTIEDSIMYYFPLKQLQHLIAHSPELNTAIMQSMISKIRLLAGSIMLSGLSAEQRIAYTILDICKSRGEGVLFITQQDLANYLGLTRITVYKILKKLKNEGVVDIKDRTIVIKRFDLLENYVNL